jgi:murein DD-endopeptidase MepM/ murein hydrolase activator NlpD
MKYDHFVVVLGHSLGGRLRRIHVPNHAMYLIMAMSLVGCCSLFGIVTSYGRMAWKVANYNALKGEADTLRARYRNLEKEVSQTQERLASLQLYAREVSLAYGIKQRIEGPADISAEGKLVPSFAESVEDYNFLRGVHSLALRSRTGALRTVSKPSLWPVDGLLMGPFGQRNDPFSGEGEFHKGVDISAPQGTSVRASADGVVTFSEWSGGYGRLVIVDHGGGIQTFYAHLSHSFVHPGQEIRRGEWVGAVGATGRVTAPHLHYEVRLGGAPVNPYRYLAKAGFYEPPSASKDFPF